MNRLLKFAKDYKWTVRLTGFAIIAFLLLALFDFLNNIVPESILATVLLIYIAFFPHVMVLAYMWRISIPLLVLLGILTYTFIGYLVDKKYYKVALVTFIIIIVSGLLYLRHIAEYFA